MRQILEIGRHRALVARLFRVGAQRRDLADEALVLARLLGLEVRAQRIGILLGAADAVLDRQGLGGFDVRRSLALLAGPRLVAQETGKLLQVPRLGHAPGRHGDRLGTAGDDRLRIAQRHGADGGENGIEAGAALAVDGRRRRGFGQTGRQRDEPRRVASL